MNARCPGIRALAVALLAALTLLSAQEADAVDLRERLRELGAAVMQKIRKLRGLEPAPKPPAPPPIAEPSPAPPTEAPSGAEASVPPPPAPAREPGIALKAQCQGKDETGYVEAVDLDIEDGRVNRLEARVEVPKRGTCRFELSDFRQTRERPHIELLSTAGDACAVRLWQQGGKLVLAATDCPGKCTRPGTFEYVWPIELDAASGNCL